MVSRIDRSNLIGLAHEWASNVIAQAATLISNMCEQADNRHILEMSDEDALLFMQIFLQRINCAYTMQIQSIAAKIRLSESYVEGDIEPVSSE